MGLSTLDGKQISRIPHKQDFDALVNRLGPTRTGEIRQYLVTLVDEMPPDLTTAHRTFSSSHLGSKLSPWPYPLLHLYDVAWEILGRQAEEEIVQERAGLWFGLFVWESIMDRDEEWVFYDPNLSSTDPNREVIGKVYFERG